MSAAIHYLSETEGERQLPLVDQLPREEALTDRNWRTYAARHYSNPQCIGDEEFEQDMRRLKYIKKAITRYRATGDVCERLILNHMIVLSNVLGPVHACRLMFLRMSDQLDVLKPFMVMLRMIPASVSVDGRTWVTDDIVMDPRIVEVLRRI